MITHVIINFFPFALKEGIKMVRCRGNNHRHVGGTPIVMYTHRHVGGTPIVHYYSVKLKLFYKLLYVNIM